MAVGTNEGSNRSVPICYLFSYINNIGSYSLRKFEPVSIATGTGIPSGQTVLFTISQIVVNDGTMHQFHINYDKTTPSVLITTHAQLRFIRKTVTYLDLVLEISNWLDSNETWRI